MGLGDTGAKLPVSYGRNCSESIDRTRKNNFRERKNERRRGKNSVINLNISFLQQESISLHLHTSAVL